jgi:hypothetical protein
MDGYKNERFSGAFALPIGLSTNKGTPNERYSKPVRRGKEPVLNPFLTHTGIPNEMMLRQIYEMEQRTQGNCYLCSRLLLN